MPILAPHSVPSKEPTRHVVKPVKPRADIRPGRTKPLTISLLSAKESVHRIMNEFNMVVAEETPSSLKLLFTPKQGKVKLSSILRYAERIKSTVGPNVTFAGPYSEGDVGGLQVNITRTITLAACLTSHKIYSSMLFETLYSGIYHTLVEAAFKQDKTNEVEDLVYRAMVAHKIECSVAEQSVLRVAGSDNMIEHLVALVQDWKSPKTLHYAHSILPIVLTTKSGKVQVAKGDPFSYRYDPSKNALYIALPAHGIVKEAEIIVTPLLQDWIVRSDPKSKHMFELVLSK